MQYDRPLLTGRLIKRYKRFLADIRLDNGQEITAHCANTGSMKNCGVAGDRVWVYDSQNPQRKLPYSWEWVEVAQQYKVCINTARANQLVEEALRQNAIPELAGPYQIQREPKVEDGRLDFLLTDLENNKSIYIEVKSVTLLDDLVNKTGVGSFPDAVTERGLKHLQRLSALKQQGYRAVLLFCVPHEGVSSVRAAHEIDIKYAEMLRTVYAEGVEVLAYRVEFGKRPETMRLVTPLSVSLNFKE